MSIHIISQFLEVVFSNYDTWPNDKKLFFRGHADKDWKLLPSVFRLDQNGKTHDERSLILDYKQVSVSEMDYRGKIENMLVEMQHLGMPTRMLDWSLSPLVALYFACQSNINPKTRKETDGAVYALNPWEAYKRVTEKLAPHPELMDILKESRMLLAQKWELDWIRKFIKQKYGYKLAKEVLRAPVPFVGRYMVDRVASQQSGFVIWGDDYKKSNGFIVHTPLNKFTDYNGCLSEPFVIAANDKHDVLISLRMIGIDSFTIFPDETGIKKEINEVKGLFNYK